jgi:hypothetical protein
MEQITIPTWFQAMGLGELTETTGKTVGFSELAIHTQIAGNRAVGYCLVTDPECSRFGLLVSEMPDGRYRFTDGFITDLKGSNVVSVT